MNFITITSVIPTSLPVTLEGFRAFGMFFSRIISPTKSVVLCHGSHLEKILISYYIISRYKVSSTNNTKITFIHQLGLYIIMSFGKLVRTVFLKSRLKHTANVTAITSITCTCKYKTK